MDSDVPASPQQPVRIEDEMTVDPTHISVPDTYDSGPDLLGFQDTQPNPESDDNGEIQPGQGDQVCAEALTNLTSLEARFIKNQKDQSHIHSQTHE
ncbi:hypothetical protein FKM82_009754 [Ascaphus truei]